MGIKKTLKERKFITAYIENNGNASKAYRATHPKYKGENSHVLGCRMLIKVNITTNELLDEMGMNDEQLHEKLHEGLDAKKVVSVIPVKPKEAQPNTTDLGNANSRSIEFIDVEDYPTRHKYLDMAYKLKGVYPSEKHDVKVEGKINSKVESIIKMEEGQLDKIIESLTKASADNGTIGKEEKGS